MISRKAIQVLMLSPLYFKLKLRQRKQLIQHYCTLFASVCKDAPVNSAGKIVSQ